MTYTSQAEVRAAFWKAHENLAARSRWRGTLSKGQNSQDTDTRIAFVDYVDALERNGDISEALARRVTL